MDIYVVSNVWDREGATVIGAAGDLDTAQQIADRLDGRPEVCDRWAPWITRAGTGRPAVLERSALLPDSTVHPSLYQEVVCVPLAGFIGDWPIKGLTTEGPAAAVALMKPEIGGEVRNDPLGIFTTERG